jgi:HTH-type transcriptional regulator/antitoxin HigA
MVNAPKLFDTGPEHPGKRLRRMLDEKGWTQEELSKVLGRSRNAITDITTGRTGITPEMAVALGAVFPSTTAAQWMQWDATYRLSILENDGSDIAKRAKLYEAAPIRDMQKRGWIKETDSLVELEKELESFFGCRLDEDLVFPVAAHRTIKLSDLNPPEKAWSFRARQLATVLPVAPFSKDRLELAEKKLRRLAAFPKEARHLPNLLAEFGIAFVVVEPLPGARIDGAAFWIGEKPVIAISVRYDRIDAFWYTVMHEFAHVRNGDAISIDTDLISEGAKGIAVRLVEDAAERRANEQAASSLVPPDEIESFIRRVGPLYSKSRIVQLAHKLKIHPGIIVGQLQYRGEIGYNAHRELLVKVKGIVIETALTDGWGRSMTPGLM